MLAFIVPQIEPKNERNVKTSYPPLEDFYVPFDQIVDTYHLFDFAYCLTTAALTLCFSRGAQERKNNFQVRIDASNKQNK